MDIVTYNNSFEWDKISIDKDTCALEALLEIFFELRAGWRTSRIEACLLHLEILSSKGLDYEKPFSFPDIISMNAFR